MPGTSLPPNPGQRKSLKRGTVIGIAVGAVVLLLLCVGGIMFATDLLGQDDFAAGKCIKHEKSGSSDKVVPVDCDSGGAYRILNRISDTTKVESGACPSDTTFAFVNYDQKYVLCLKAQH
jgi:hypothetical protein